MNRNSPVKLGTVAFGSRRGLGPEPVLALDVWLVHELREAPVSRQGSVCRNPAEIRNSISPGGPIDGVSALSKGLFSGGLVAELLDVRGLPRVHRYEMNEPLRLATEPRDPGPPEASRSFETYYDAESAPVRVPLSVRRGAVGKEAFLSFGPSLARENAQVWLVSPIPSDGDRAGR